MSDTDQRSVSMRELTVRGIILGGLITLLFTAANVYLGLKVGLTFATSIPAAGRSPRAGSHPLESAARRLRSSWTRRIPSPRSCSTSTSGVSGRRLQLQTASRE